MSVEIKDADPLPVILPLPVAGGNDAVVEKAETVRLVGLGMMPRWTGLTKDHRTRFLFHHIDADQTGPGRQSGDLVGIVADLIIRMIDIGPAGKDCLFKTEKPTLGVKGEQLGAQGRPRG